MKRAMWLVAAAGVVACQPSDGLPADYRPVVISAVLMAGDSVQTLTIWWAATAIMQSPVGAPSATDVNLWVVSPRGDSVPVVATARAGDFTVALTPLQGMTYRLAGTVLNLPIAAHTTVPTLAIIAPAEGDTLRRDRFGQFSVPLELQTRGAPGFEVTGTNLTVAGSGYLTSDPAVNLYAIPDSAKATVMSMEVIANDSNLVAFKGLFVQTGPTAAEPFGSQAFVGGSIITTVQGALGVFGSITVAHVTFVVPP